MDPSMLPSLALFAAVARHQSFSRAAAELHVSRAALSKNLKALEKRVNVRLLNRTTRDMSLTDEGQKLLKSLTPALASIELAVRSLQDAQDCPSGLLRINTARSAARVLIEPYIAEFFERYPRIRLELVMDDGLSNIISDGCDAGIRLGENLSEHVVAAPITPRLEMVVAGSPAYFAKRSMPKSTEELVHHNCISFRNSASGSIHHWEFSSQGNDSHVFRVEPRGSLVANDDESMINAALQGVGLIQHINISIQHHLTEGRLVRVLHTLCKPFPGFYLYFPTRVNMTPRVRALINFLAEKNIGFVAEQCVPGH